MPSNVAGNDNNYGGGNTYGQKGNESGQPRRKNRIFAPVTMKMVREAEVVDNDACEIDGEPINDVSARPVKGKFRLLFADGS